MTTEENTTLQAEPEIVLGRKSKSWSRRKPRTPSTVPGKRSDSSNTYIITRPSNPTFANLASPVWEQQESETHDDFMAFLFYAQMPVSNRSLQSSYRAYYNVATVYKPASTRYMQLAYNMCWEQRAAEWDLERSRELERKWLERQLEWREQNWTTGERLRAVALPAIDNVNEEDMRQPINIAKFLALGSELQEKSLPSRVQLQGDQVKTILENIDPGKRETVLRILMAEITTK